MNKPIPKPDLRGFEITGVTHPNESSDYQMIYVWTNPAFPNIIYHHVVEADNKAVNEWYKV